MRTRSASRARRVSIMFPDGQKVYRPPPCDHDSAVQAVCAREKRVFEPSVTGDPLTIRRRVPCPFSHTPVNVETSPLHALLWVACCLTGCRRRKHMNVAASVKRCGTCSNERLPGWFASKTPDAQHIFFFRNGMCYGFELSEAVKLLVGAWLRCFSGPLAFQSGAERAPRMQTEGFCAQIWYVRNDCNHKCASRVDITHQESNL